MIKVSCNINIKYLYWIFWNFTDLRIGSWHFWRRRTGLWCLYLKSNGSIHWMARIIRQKGSHFYHYRSECDPVTIVSSRYLTLLPGLYLYLAVKTEHQTMIGCRIPLFILPSSCTPKSNREIGKIVSLSLWNYYYCIKTLLDVLGAVWGRPCLKKYKVRHLIAPVLSLIFVNDLCRPLEDLISIMSSIEREVIIS